MKRIFYPMLMLFPGVLFAQEIDMDAMAKIRKEGMDNSKVKEIAHQLTDVSGPRLTNSPGFQRAAEWSVGEMKKWGLTQFAYRRMG